MGVPLLPCLASVAVSSTGEPSGFGWPGLSFRGSIGVIVSALLVHPTIRIITNKRAFGGVGSRRPAGTWRSVAGYAINHMLQRLVSFETLHLDFCIVKQGSYIGCRSCVRCHDDILHPPERAV